MKKKVTYYIRLTIPAAQATPTPPIGPALGQYGVNLMEFCKEFNNLTKHIHKTVTIPVAITVFGNKTVSFKLSQPNNSYFLRNVLDYDEELDTTVISLRKIYEIALYCHKHFHVNTRKMCTTLIGSVRAMLVTIIE